MINAVTKFAHGTFGNNFTLACGIAAAIPAAEMAIRVFADLQGMMQNRADDIDSKKKFEQHGKDFTANLGGALFYGLLAANFIPGSAVFGAACFSVYSGYKYYYTDQKECYLTSKWLCQGIEFLVRDAIGKPIKEGWNQVVAPTSKQLWNRVIKPTYNAILKPVIEKITAYAKKGFEVMRKFFAVLGELLAKIPMPTHPIWAGVVLVVTAIAVYKVAFSILLVV